MQALGATLRPQPGGQRGDDHRHRRAGGIGQGHAGQAHRRAFRPAPPRHRAALPRRGPRRAPRAAARSTTAAAALRAARGARPGHASTIPACAAPGRRGRLHRRPHPRGAHRPARVPARLRRASPAAPCSTAATSAPSSAPTPTLRSTSPPRPEVRAQRRYLEMTGPRRGRHIRGRAGRYPPPRRARCGRGSGAHAAGRRRLLAGYQQFGYRSRIRHRRRSDPKEGWPARARLKACARNPVGTRILRRQNSHIMGTELALAARRCARHRRSRPLDGRTRSRKAWSRSRNEHRRQ